MSESREQPGKASPPSAKPCDKDGSEEDLSTRALAVLVAIPVFAISLYLGLITASMSARLAAHILIRLPRYFYVAYFGLALFVGLRFGMSGITNLLGHLFGTHFDNQADRRITAGLWVGLIAVTLLAYALGGQAHSA